jgi:hypothetical protein
MKKEFPKTAIAHELGRTKSTSSIDKIIKELESESFIKFKGKKRHWNLLRFS